MQPVTSNNAQRREMKNKTWGADGWSEADADASEAREGKPWQARSAKERAEAPGNPAFPA
jgi:hypothetical protein